MAKTPPQPFTRADEQHYARILRAAVDLPALMRLDGADLEIYGVSLARLHLLLENEMARIGRELS